MDVCVFQLFSHSTNGFPQNGQNFIPFSVGPPSFKRKRLWQEVSHAEPSESSAHSQAFGNVFM
jgi:hypothetical protein